MLTFHTHTHTKVFFMAKMVLKCTIEGPFFIISLVLMPPGPPRMTRVLGVLGLPRCTRLHLHPHQKILATPLLVNDVYKAPDLLSTGSHCPESKVPPLIRNSSVKTTPRMSNKHPNWVILAPNWTNLGLFKISFSTFWLGELLI